MRLRLLVLIVVGALGAAPAATAAPTIPHGRFASEPPPAPVFGPSPVKSFKIELLA